MRPIRLTLRNIGPYENETIDFTKLDDIFLITGNTGSGKTFLFDAMTYALYGELRGNREKHQKDLKSRYASPDEEEFYVDFTFQIADCLYRIRRTVEFTKPGRKTASDETVTFMRKRPEDEGFIDLAGANKKNKTDINKMILNVIGLTVDEFSRIVLLPQGAFAEFLKQNSSERQKTLEKLFPVDDYKRILEEAERRDRDYTTRMNDIQAVISSELNTLTEAGYDLNTIDEVMAEMQEDLSGLEESERDNAEQARKYAAEQAELNHQLEVAEKYEADLRRQKELKDQEAEFDEREALIGRAEKANELREFISASVAAQRRVDEAGNNLETAVKAYDEAQTEVTRLASQKEVMEALKEKNATDKTNLDSMKEKLSRLQELSDARDEEDQHLSESRAIQEKIDLLDGEIAELTKSLEGRKIEQCIQDVTDALMESQRKLGDLENKKDNAQKRDSLSGQLKDAAEEVTCLEKALTDAQEALTRSENTLSLLRTQIDENKAHNAAWSLSRLLKPGEACPVCGSLEHPKPAEPAEELLKPEEELEAHELMVASARERVSAAQQSLSAARTRKEQLAEQLKAYADLAPTETIQDALVEAKKVNDDLVQKKNGLTELQETLSSKNTESGRLKDEKSRADTSHASARTKRESLEKEIGDSPDSLQEQYDSLVTEYEHNVHKYDSWKDAIDEAGRVLASRESSKSAWNESKEAATRELENASAELSKQLSSSVFSTVEEAEKSMMDMATLSAEREACQEYRSEVRSVRDALKKSTAQKSSDEIRIAINELDTSVVENNNIIASLRNQIDDKRAALTTLSNSYDKVRDRKESLSVLEKESLPCRKLYEHLSGRNKAKVQFDTWALGMYFDQIVEYASDRFFEISNHRFEFILKDIAEKTGNGYKGLDLQVIDHNTPDQKPSDPADLSGGETFEASISLALAITDVVQNNSGGITLDSLFIDEGFGTLDPEPLESTMKVLNELSETKMIGLISHVDSLQDSESGITSQVRVHKTDHGSTISIK